MDKNKKHYDRIGHELNTGDTVYFMPVGYRGAIPGKIISMSDKMCTMQHEHPNIRDYQTTTKQFYNQVFLDTKGFKKA